MWHSISQGVRSAKAQAKVATATTEDELGDLGESIAVDDDSGDSSCDDQQEPRVLGIGKKHKGKKAVREAGSGPGKGATRSGP